MAQARPIMPAPITATLPVVIFDLSSASTSLVKPVARPGARTAARRHATLRPVCGRSVHASKSIGINGTPKYNASSAGLSRPLWDGFANPAANRGNEAPARPTNIGEIRPLREVSWFPVPSSCRAVAQPGRNGVCIGHRACGISVMPVVSERMARMLVGGAPPSIAPAPLRPGRSGCGS